MKNEVSMNWKGNMSFEGEVNGHKLMLDADLTAGGENKGPRPKPLMLMALAGCTGMDVVSILKKMRVDLDDFNVKVSADLTEEHPMVYSTMHIIYEFKGKNLDLEKINKAVSLSQDRYCGVSAMYKQFAKITHEIKIIES
ncbi:MAG TPA: OsmC family protein [Salinivirgaceae bacterium]|nr:OsmC family protein [Salinivirgaceae bacterium]HQA75932.1 OsmC family protein [Salinivirgaceae bacterium]